MLCSGAGESVCVKNGITAKMSRCDTRASVSLVSSGVSCAAASNCVCCGA